MRGRTGAVFGVRRALAAACAVVVGSVTVPAVARDAGGDEADLGPDQLELVDETTLSPRLHELTFTTPALDHDTSVRVLVPDDFDPSGRRRYPVLYLLHGGGDNYRSWTDKGEASEATAGLDLIVVMPDNARHGNYVDWYNNGHGGAPMWETYIIDQLVPFIDEAYPTVSTRDGRAVAGLSMGGGGAMGYAARHPDMFTAAAAFSGAVDTNTLVVQFLVLTSGMEDGAAFAAVHGGRIANEVRWRGHNPWDLAANLDVDMLLHLRTGNGLPGGPGGDSGDPVEFLVREQMVNMHRRLARLGIDHVWDDYGPGGHNWFYWRRGLRQFLPDLMDRFAHPVPPPDAVSFRAVEPEYSVFGWDVTLRRWEPEFSYLVDASRSGFALRGSGTATVVSPPHFRPGAPIEVTVTDHAGRSTATVTADEDGRVATVVDLGPANRSKQFSPYSRLRLLLPTGPDAWPVRTATVAFDPPGA